MACDSAGPLSTALEPLIDGELTMGYPGVGALVVRRTQCQEVPDTALCTVTLIGERHVLTAGHCVADALPRRLAVLFAAGLNTPGAQTYPIVKTTLHPFYDSVSSDYDVAILELDRAPPIAPVETEAMDAEWIDREITLVGFGETRDGLGGGLKRVGTGRIEAIDAQTFQFAPAPSLTCRGDSGGPALVTIDGQFKIIGVVSSGDNACETHGINVRTDALADFIASNLDPSETRLIFEGSMLCTEECTTDAECPSQLLCQKGFDGTLRCQHPQIEHGDFKETCLSNEGCESGHCAPFEGACACFTPCTAEAEPSGSDEGCTTTPGSPMWLLWGVLALKRRRRTKNYL